MISALVDHRDYVLLALVAWTVLYFVYKIGWRRDYGMPVRRRLIALHLRVEREQIAYVPFWWSDLQVQRALDGHWQRTMRRSFERRPTIRAAR